MFRLLLSIIWMIAACGTQPRRTPPHPGGNSQVTALQEKSNLYVSLLPERLGPSGFLFTEVCDSLLFSGLLASAAPELGIDISAARNTAGQWFRRPVSMPECYTEFQEGRRGSRSTISRDMFTGLFWWLYTQKQAGLAENTLQYARDHDYVMGQGDPSRISLMPNLTRQLANIVSSLTGQSQDEDNLPVTYATELTGYELHILTWQILLDARIHGGITDRQLEVLADAVTRYPANPLYQAAYHKYTDGNQSEAIRLLLDTGHWPADRLPHSETEHRSAWPLEDDPGPMWEPGIIEDWKPQPSGAELVAIYRLVIQ